MEDGTDNHTTAQINKLLILYGCFTNRELYRYYGNLRYFPKVDTNQVVQQTLEELKIVF